MRYALLALFALAACSPDSTSPRVQVPHAPSFAMDLTAPPAPTEVSAVVDSVSSYCPSCDARAYLTVTWTDNSAFADESVTCGAFMDANGDALGSGCSYASNYDAPPGSTGVRQSLSGEFVAVPGGVYRLSLATTRRISNLNITGPSSESVTVDASGAVATTSTKRKGKH